MRPKYIAAAFGIVILVALGAIIARAQLVPQTLDVRATWNAPTNIVPDGYLIHWGPKGQPPENSLRVEGTTSVILKDIPMDQEIEFRVQATLGNLRGKLSAPAYYQPIDAPTGLTIDQVTVIFRQPN